MGQGYGPKALTPGVAQQFRIAKNAVRVQVKNFSRYYLGVYFGSDFPQGGTASALAPGWHDVLEPGDKPVLEIVGNYTQDYRAIEGFSGTGFTGDVFVMPISVDPNLGLTGGMSSNFASLTSYQSNENPPQSTSASRIIDASSQARYVAVPIATGLVNAGPTSLTVDLVIRTDTLNAVIPLSDATHYSINAYLYDFEMVPVVPAVGVFYSMTGALFADLMNGAVVVSSAVMYQFYIWSDNIAAVIPGVKDDRYAPAVPKVSTFTGAWPATLTAVRWRLHPGAINGATNILWNIGVGTDLVNPFNPGTHGAFTPITGIF
jgi:hypothetical protein